MNYYTHFCTTIQRLTEEEAAWLEAHLEQADAEGLALEHHLSGDHCQLFSDQMGDEELTAIQDFFVACRPSEYLVIDYACTADGGGDDAYGGGSVFVSADDLSRSNVTPWRKQCVTALSMRVGGPVRAASEKGA